MTTKRKINILTLFVIVLLLLIIFLYNKVYYAEQLVDKTNKVLVVENENLSDYNKAILNKAKKIASLPLDTPIEYLVPQ